MQITDADNRMRSRVGEGETDEDEDEDEDEFIMVGRGKNVERKDKAEPGRSVDEENKFGLLVRLIRRR